MRRTLALLALLLTMAWSGAACSGAPPISAPETSTPAVPTTTAPPGTAGPGVPRMLDFTAPRAGGGTVRGADLAGRDVAVWLWAPW